MVPGETAVTTPVVALTVATPGVELVQTPPAVAQVSVPVLPHQIAVVPPIAATDGVVETVMGCVVVRTPQAVVNV